MNRKSMLTIGIAAVWFAGLGGYAISAQDKYAVKVPAGWRSRVQGIRSMADHLHQPERQGGRGDPRNPVMIDAYRAGIPGTASLSLTGQDAKIHWKPKPNQFFPDATVPGDLVNVDFMVKDSKRFADSGGWGYAVFDYNTASDTFTPGPRLAHHRRERRQVRFRMPHGGEDERLRLYGYGKR
jgi:hypothetical protein